MKYLKVLLFFVLTSPLFAQQAFRMELLGHWNDTTLPGQINTFADEKQIWNDLMGWTHPASGREFIIIGSIDSTYFFDVTNPAEIKKCAAHSGRVRSVNRDYEVYKNYVYCVSDNGPAGVLQIIDLQYLPDSIHVISEDSSISSRTHSIFIDSVSKRLYLNAAGVGQLRYDMLILSLDSPEKPKVIGELRHPACERVHEAYFRNDTAYCSCEWRGLHVYDMRKSDSILYIGGIRPPYPFNGYNHTSWVSPDGKFIAFTDELPTGLPLKLYSIENGGRSFDFEAVFNSNEGTTPHNVFWKEHLLYTSAYEDGVVIWNMKNPLNPQKEAWYDTYPKNTEGIYNGFTGCWGVYPYFKSGNIAASDMRNGLFMLKYDATLSTHNISKRGIPMIKAFPNPFTDNINVQLHTESNQQAFVQVFSSQGKLLLEKNIHLQIGENNILLNETSNWVNGVYILRIYSEAFNIKQVLVK
jgi:choice-of-anchor B domain-containing protein